jgi:hypothetical protein
MFEHYGQVMMMATPAGRIMYVGDADVNHQILSRRQDFPKDISMYSEFLRVSTPSVVELLLLCIGPYLHFAEKVRLQTVRDINSHKRNNALEYKN